MHARANAGQIRCASSSRNASGSRGAGIRRMSRTSRIPRTSRALGRRSEGRPTRGALCTRLAGSRILHAGDQVLRLVLRQTETFVLLGVGKARVHGQRESRGVPARVEGIGCTGAPCRPQRQQQPAARGRPQPFRKQRAARREQLRVLAQRVACDQQRPVPCGAQLLGSRHGPHDAVGFQTVDARIGHGEPHGIHLFAHGVGHHQHRAAHARMPRAPRHRVERRHAHQGHAERRRHALGRGQRNAHTGERSRAAPAHDARDLALRATPCAARAASMRGSSCVLDARRASTSKDSTYIHRGGVFARHDLRQQSSQAQGDHLVGRVEREHVRRRAGMPAFRGLKRRWDVVCHSECLFYE